MNIHAHRTKNRVWLYVNNRTFRVEVYFGKRANWLGILVNVGGEDGLDIGISLPFLIKMYVAIPVFVYHPYETYRTCIMWWSELITLDIWHDELAWEPTGYSWSCLWVDRLKGQHDYSETPGETNDAVVSMPEGDYPAKIRLYQATWKFPRWFTKTMSRAEIDMIKPVPIPGKGESVWNLEDDAISSVTTSAETVEDAVKAVQKSALYSRRKYGPMIDHPST